MPAEEVVERMVRRSLDLAVETFLAHARRRDLMHEESDGTLVLEPAVVVPELERRFMENAALQAQIEHSRAHPEQRRPRRSVA